MADITQRLIDALRRVGIDVIDMRGQLARRNWSIGTVAQKTSRTIHYNGGAVPDRSRNGEIRTLEADARWHTTPGALGAPNGGDGLQYAIAIGYRGEVYINRELIAILWHCANQTGNAMSLSILFILGGEQDASPEQWETFEKLDQILDRELGMGGEDDVWGHGEWRGASTQCPGKLQRRLIAWRADNSTEVLAETGDSGHSFVSRRLYRITGDGLRLRDKPGTYGTIIAVLDIDGDVYAPDANGNADPSRLLGRVPHLDVDFDTQGTLVADQFTRKSDDTWVHVRDGSIPGIAATTELYASAMYVELITRKFRAKTNVIVRSGPASTYTPVDVPPHGTQVAANATIDVAEEREGRIPPGYSSNVWLRFAGRTVFVFKELFEEVQ